MSKESNSNWQNRKRQKGDCLYQAVACLKLLPPAMKLWEAFENVCLDWLIFPVLRKSLKIIKTIIKLLTKLSPRNEKLEVGTRQWIQFPSSVCTYVVCHHLLKPPEPIPVFGVSNRYMWICMLDHYWGCLSHKLKGARALAVCLWLYQIDFPPLIN